MKNVWSSLCDIPYGETRSYKEIAQILNKDKAYRAVGLANNKNPIPIFGGPFFNGQFDRLFRWA